MNPCGSMAPKGMNAAGKRMRAKQISERVARIARSFLPAIHTAFALRPRSRLVTRIGRFEIPAARLIKEWGLASRGRQVRQSRLTWTRSLSGRSDRWNDAGGSAHTPRG